MTNHYEILGVSKDADATEIKKVYRKLSLQYHPDRNPDPEATEKYKQINEAYEVISDPQKREQYNMELQQGSGGFPGGFPGGSMGGDMNDIFSMMFGGGFPGGPNMRVFHSGGGGFPGQVHHMNGFPGQVHHMNGFQGGIEQIFQQFQKPQPIHKHIHITLEQVYTGVSVPIEIERQCNKNNITSQEIETIHFSIPAGIDESETIWIKDKGHYISDNMKGDVKITLQVDNNTIFNRNGIDLLYTKHISLKESLCGFGFEIQHLNGKSLHMNNMSNPAIVKPNYKKVVPGLGINKNGQTGNLIIELVVDFPDTLTSSQIDSLRNIL